MHSDGSLQGQISGKLYQFTPDPLPLKKNEFQSYLLSLSKNLSLGGKKRKPITTPIFTTQITFQDTHSKENHLFIFYYLVFIVLL